MRLLQMIKDQKRVRQQGLCTWSAATRSIAAVVERNDGAVRKEAVQIKGHALGIPGIPPEAQERWQALSSLSFAWYSHARQSFTVCGPNLQALC
jgi:hypothetical protein